MDTDTNNFAISEDTLDKMREEYERDKVNPSETSDIPSSTLGPPQALL
jgi:hypothetical protein